MEDGNKLLKVGIIGLGDVSPFHLQAIEENKQAELAAVCDTDESLRENSEGVPFYTDYIQMIEECELDVVHNCLPHHLHYPVTKKCVEANLHVFLEKPVAISYKEALLQQELEESSESKICVCFQNRYNETFKTLRESLSKEEVGDIQGIKGLVTWFRENDYYEQKPWRRTKSQVGYGNIMSQSIHTLDLIQLLGGEVDSVKATLSKLLDVDSEVEDTVSAVLAFKNGSKGYLHATNANISNSSVELEIITENETFTIKDENLYRTLLDGTKEKLVSDKQLIGEKSYYGASHSYLIDAFYKAILNNTNEYVSVEDALPSIQLIEMMAESSKTVAEPKTVVTEELSKQSSER